MYKLTAFIQNLQLQLQLQLTGVSLASLWVVVELIWNRVQFSLPVGGSVSVLFISSNNRV